jgi:leucyl-tRNA synthetase
MDPHNDAAYFSKEANLYWKSVDLYFGGDEHATGHLIYARFWNKFLFDLDLACEDEPFKKMINQGKIQGRSSIMYRLKNKNIYISQGLRKNYDSDHISNIHVDISLVNEHDELDIEAFKKWQPESAKAEFVLEDGKYICGFEIEKMSKSLYNVENPDEIIEKYGADAFRLYEMFLGPLKNHKPWDTKGIEGVFRFIRKLWRLFHDDNNQFVMSDEQPSPAELKVIHRTIKQVKEDIERFSFNTGVSNFMICVNELHDLKCNKRAILEDLLKIISPYAPHIAEELWLQAGHPTSVSKAAFPDYNEELLRENTYTYPVSFNGKMRFKIEFPVNMAAAEIEKEILAAQPAQKWLEEKQVKKVIVVPGKIINVVLG